MTTPPCSTAVVVDVLVPTPSILALRVDDATGRTVRRRRVRDSRVALDLPAGGYRFTLTDDRAPHDPARLAPASADLVVPAAGARIALRPSPGAVVAVATAPWAVVAASCAGAAGLVETRADGEGRAVLAGLRPGAWVVAAHDRRRDLWSPAATVDLAAGSRTAVDLVPTLPAARLLVQVGGTDRRPVRATDVLVTDDLGRTTRAPLRDGVADLRGLRPGTLLVVVPASVGHRGAVTPVEAGPGSVVAPRVTVPVGATVAGRVVQGRRPQHAAVVALVDEDGREVERTRTDPAGRFELGRGLGVRAGLTVVATTGPETLHVTRAAVADLATYAGVRHHLADLALPVGGPAAVWRARRAPATPPRLPHA
ncbi:hypothetical protein [Nocardioides litoris]|uniref:hypothetical protein n=1 Tax=Nocardioides litoris TaxID=1926648 RepID=UPI001122FB01|nr:hypothetical protein [Nocardioides litoris]